MLKAQGLYNHSTVSADEEDNLVYKTLDQQNKLMQPFS